MYTFKRMIAYLFILLFIISLYKDITGNTVIDLQNEEKSVHPDLEIIQEHKNYKVVSVKVDYGETALSIIEKINNQNDMKKVNIEDILSDIQYLNPNVNLYDLKPNNTYFFPLYYK